MKAIPRRCLVTLVTASALAFAHPASAQPAKTHKVDISMFKFMPETINIRVGDSIVFVNKDFVPHTATSQDASWDSGEISGGSEWAYRFEQAGRFGYFCRYHPAMKGEVEVKP